MDGPGSGPAAQAGARPALLLASSSSRRLALLAQIGIVPDAVLSPEIDETPRREELPRQYACRIAAAKRDAARAARPDRDELVLAADTVVALGRRILPRADTEAEARRCLALLSGRRHTVMTAVALGVPGGGAGSLRVVQSVVALGRLTGHQIDALIAHGDWRGKAGGYAIQGRIAAHVRFLSGSHSNVVGLPLFETAQLLRGRGWPD